MVRTCWVALTLALCAPGAFAQAYSPPRTADGRPDLQGVWGTAFVTPIERPDSAKALVPDEAQVKALIAEMIDLGPIGDPDIQHQGVSELAVVNGQKRTSIIAYPADGRLPFTEKGRKVADHGYWLDQNGFDNPEERPGFERCTAGFGQPPIRQIPLTIRTQIVQTRDAFVLNTEDVQSFRMVHTKPPSAHDLPTLNGYSWGRWDGDTLVIETTRTRADDPYRGHFGRAIVVEPDSVIVEKLTRLSDDELLYQFTVQDADLYTGPWLGEYVFRLTKGEPALEYACHEANYSMVNMLKSGRVADERAAAKKKPKGKR